MSDHEVSLSAERVPAIDISVGDRVALVGTTTYFTVEWIRVWEDGGVSMSGVRSTGEPHTSSLSAGALVSRVFSADDLMDTQLSDLIARAESALEGVTDGPWEVRDGFVYPLSIRCGLGGIWERDARFIAAARSLFPELVAALKAKDAELEKMRAEVVREHGLFTQEAAATNRRVSEAWQAGFVEGQRR